MDKQVILFGAGIVGRSVFYYYQPEQVYCFVDNYKCGEEFCGKKVISFEELYRVHTEYKVIITVAYPKSQDVLKLCESNSIPAALYYEEFVPENFQSKPEIAILKDIHKGKRCFIIGNGPSLSPTDLDALHKNNEICFASNYINRIYPYTKWRPNYYMIMDTTILSEDFAIIKEAEADMIILPELAQRYYGDIDSAHLIIKSAVDSGTPVAAVVVLVAAGNTLKPYFSSDASRLIYSIWTVTASHLQLAAYMGFSEIYLLGCDNTPGDLHDVEKFVSEQTHFYKENDMDINIALKTQSYVANAELRKVQTQKQYEYFDEYSRTHGFRLYNATRGGNLEAFERVDFDKLFDRDAK